MAQRTAARDRVRAPLLQVRNAMGAQTLFFAPPGPELTIWPLPALTFGPADAAILPGRGHDRFAGLPSKARAAWAAAPFSLGLPWGFSLDYTYARQLEI